MMRLRCGLGPGRALVALGGFLAIALSPLASGAESLNYVSAGVGFHLYTGDVQDRTNLDGAFDGEIAYGRRVHPNLALRAGVGYFHDGHDRDDLRGYPVSLTAIGIYPRGSLSLFAGLGVAVYPVEFDGRIDGVRVEDRDVVLGGHILVGASLDVWASVFVGLEAKYRVLEEARLGGQRLDLDGFTLSTTLGFRF